MINNRTYVGSSGNPKPDPIKYGKYVPSYVGSNKDAIKNNLTDAIKTRNMDPIAPTQYSEPTTTANSKSEGRLKVDVAGKKRKILKDKISPVSKASDIVHRDNIY